MKKTILSIDCGTQSLRAMLFSGDGTLIGKTRIEYPPYASPKPGWAEQEPEVYWNSLCAACNRLRDSHPESFKKIEAVGITTIRNSMVNVDEEGHPLRPIITWLDQRKAKKIYSPNGLMKLIYGIIGMDNALDKAHVDGKCNWIKQYQPEIWKKTYKYLQISGFLNHRLTGKFIDSTASQIGHIPINYKKMRWSKPGELTALLFPVEKEKLPDIIQPGGIIGGITQTASKLTGISEGVPVIACGSDKGCETIGMGVITDNMANLSFGTTATVQTTSKHYFEPLRFMPPYPALIPGCYNPEVEIFRGYWMISWFKNEFAHKEVLDAMERGVPPEIALNELLADVPAGSMGLMVQPFWGPGLKNPAAKGAMIGFGDVHKKAHIYRAVIEGLGYALFEGLQKIEKRGNTRIEKVAVSGGASQSDEICQISADIFNLPLFKGKTHETSGLGAAIVSAVGLGVYPSFEAAIERMVSYEKFFEPDMKNAAIYRKLHERVYKKIYASLETHYKEIRDITGYPE